MALSDHQYQIPQQYRTPEVSDGYVNQEIARMEEDLRIDREFETIVTRENQASENEIRNRFDSMMKREFTVEPEIDPRYQNAKAIESKIEQLRAMADHMTIPRYGLSALIHAAKSPFMPKDSDTLERQLLDVEARIGGEMIEDMIRQDMIRREGKARHIAPRLFFYQKGYWYYQIGLEETAPVVSYQLADNQYYKSFNGKPVSFEPGEAESLIQNIPLYFQTIQKDLYRRD